MDKGKLILKQVLMTEYFTIKIKDSGPGISDENMDKIFEPMFTTKTTGTGLGLLICKSIVEQHGGEISVTNKPTTFTITLKIYFFIMG